MFFKMFLSLAFSSTLDVGLKYSFWNVSGILLLENTTKGRTLSYGKSYVGSCFDSFCSSFYSTVKIYFLLLVLAGKLS